MMKHFVTIAILMAFCIAASAQEPRHGIRTGTVEQVDEHAKTITIKSDDGTEHTLQTEARTKFHGVHGKARNAIDTIRGLKPGTQAAAHCLISSGERFHALVDAHTASLASNDRFTQILADKRARRERDEQALPLADYRSNELARMRMNFYGFDPSYHIARHRFVYRTPHAWTPLHLARHRRSGVPIRREPVSA